jgi:NitT/TauT family transport system substrate-binding protein
VQSYFSAVPRARVVGALARYKSLGIWGSDPILPRDGYERLKDGMVSGGFVKGTDYAVAVDNSLAEQAVRDDPPSL